MVSHYIIMEYCVLHPRSDSRNWPRSSECYKCSSCDYQCVCQILWNSIIAFSRYLKTKMLQTDNGRTDGQSENSIPPTYTVCRVYKYIISDKKFYLKTAWQYTCITRNISSEELLTVYPCTGRCLGLTKWSLWNCVNQHNWDNKLKAALQAKWHAEIMS